MINSKFNIGQIVKHKLLGYIGVVIDVDPEYSLQNFPASTKNDLAANETLRHAPWYHVILQDEQGEPIHTYLSEVQLLPSKDHALNYASSDVIALSESILKKYHSENLRH